MSLPRFSAQEQSVSSWLATTVQLQALTSNMASLMELPTELRHKILASVIWTPEPRPELSLQTAQDRVRLRDDWDIWVPVSPPQPAALPLLLSCKTLRDDVAYLLSSPDATYELDVIFIPGCGLWPTWTCCPVPSQIHINIIRVSFRVVEAYDINGNIDGGEFATRFQGSCNFSAPALHPNPPPGAWNFYRLLASFLARGPRALSSPALQLRHRGSFSTCRYTIKHLIVSVTSRQETALDKENERMVFHWTFVRPHTVSDSDTMSPTSPYGSQLEIDMFPGPDPGSQYFSRSPPHPRHDSWFLEGSGGRLALYLANALWALLDFNWLSRGFGLLVYEGVLDTIEFRVDGEPQSCYDMDHILPQLSDTSYCTPDTMEALVRWREWAINWRSQSREGVSFAAPRPLLQFARSQQPNYFFYA